MKQDDHEIIRQVISSLEAPESALPQRTLSEAAALAQKTLDQSPHDADANYLAGLLAIRRGDYAQACMLISHAIRCEPGNPRFTLVHAYILGELERLDEALAAYEKVVQLQPLVAGGHNNLGCILSKLGRTREALVAYTRAISLEPQYADAYVNRGIELKKSGRLGEALADYEHAQQCNPRHAGAFGNCGTVLKDMGRQAEALDSYQRSLQLQPNNTDTQHNLLLCLNYHPALPAGKIAGMHHEWGLHYAGTTPRATSGSQRTDSRHARLRVGYVSPNLRSHSVACFFEPLLGAHHREEIEVYCYANVEHTDEVTDRLRRHTEHWRSIIGMSAQQVASQIRDDEIDILVDMAGHTAANSLSVFALKPAPVQVSWLGYPNTTGLAAIDYRLTDAIADPPGEPEELHTETLVRLDNGFLCFQPPHAAPEVTTLPALAAGHATFGCFNNLAKITPDVIESWSQLMTALPDARLFLKSRSLSDPPTQAALLKLFDRHGIGQERITLVGWLDNPGDHLKLYGQVDIALDTFPYNGATTTCEALWMGVPVVTLSGDRHAARVGASIMGRIDRPEWVASTRSSYVDIATRLASDMESLARIRKDLRSLLNASPLCNAEMFSRGIEAAFQNMWEKFLRVEDGTV